MNFGGDIKDPNYKHYVSAVTFDSPSSGNASCLPEPSGVGATGSYMYGMHQLTFRFMHMNCLYVDMYGGSPDEYAFNVGLLYGLTLRPTLIMKKRTGRSPVWLSAAVSLSGGRLI
ncbi:MAG: hypothetical protein JW913_14530 [Chitinispirillaceae bacterium]|nr:hypothetical protein [Chitinispirillaceae bacterium]